MKSGKNIIGESRGSQLDRMVEIVGDDVIGRYHHRRHRRHRRYDGQPGYQSQQQPQPVQPTQAAQPAPQQGFYNPYPYQGYGTAPVYPTTAAPAPGPQPTIDVFVGACLNKGVKSARITSYLKGIGCSDRQISRAFDKNLR